MELRIENDLEIRHIRGIYTQVSDAIAAKTEAGIDDKVMIDLSGVESIDCSGLQLITYLVEHQSDNIQFSGVSEQVNEGLLFFGFGLTE